MEKIILTDPNNSQGLQAIFLPEKGMNLISLNYGNIEIIDQSTTSLFEERFAGLGALIGPHFHRRHPGSLPKIADEALFPHIARVKAKGIADPFSHGIARYAPWKFTHTSHHFSATLTGKDTWQNVPLSQLEGQNFTMHFKGFIEDSKLHLKLDIVSDTDSLVGIHYYYRLPDGKGTVTAEVQKDYLTAQGLAPIPKEWLGEKDNLLKFDLSNEADYTFYPFPKPSQGKMTLQTSEYTLTTHYKSQSQENCWQLYHPKGASFVCMEPISSKDPHHPNLSVSSLEIVLEVSPN